MAVAVQSCAVSLRLVLPNRGGQTVALSHQSATEASNCATGDFEKIGIL